MYRDKIVVALVFGYTLLYILSTISCHIIQYRLLQYWHNKRTCRLAERRAGNSKSFGVATNEIEPRSSGLESGALTTYIHGRRQQGSGGSWPPSGFSYMVQIY